ncbi:hypothetical protein Tco_0713227 [Tanacetum coccineum]
MIGCKVMRTLASVEIETVLILGLPCCLSSSSVRCLESVSKIVAGSDDWLIYVGHACPRVVRVALRNFVDSRRAQSSRVPVPLPEDPYEAIRQAYLDGTDTESDPFEDPIDIETLESPLTIAPPISLSESTQPVLIPILRRTTRMVVRIPHVMSSGLSASMEEVASMSESALRKRFRSSYKNSPSVSPPDLPSRKRYRGTSELVEDSEEDDDEEDEEIEKSMDSDSGSSPDMHDEGYGLDDERHDRDDESRGIDDEGHSVDSDGLGLEEEEEATSRGQQQAALIVGTTMSAPLKLRYGALRHRKLTLEEGDVYSTFEVGHGSGSAPESERLERVLAFRQPTLTIWTDQEDGMIYIDIPDYPPPAPPVQTKPSRSTPAAVETEGFLTELGAQVEMQGGLIRDHVVRLEELSPALFERSLEYEQERVAVTFGAIWRPVLALEAWAGQTDAQRAALWHAISDVQGENQDLRLQLAEERRARLELAEVVDGMRRGQEPRGGDMIGRNRPWTVTESNGKSCGDRFGNLIIRLTVFWNGLPRMGRTGMVDQARFA